MLKKKRIIKQSKIHLILLLSVISLFIFLEIPSSKANSYWYIGENGDFPTISNAFYSKKISDEDHLILLNDINDRFYGFELTKSVYIDGRGHTWQIDRISQSTQLRISAKKVVIKNITIEFVGYFLKKAIEIDGNLISGKGIITFRNVNISISGGTPPDFNISTVFHLKIRNKAIEINMEGTKIFWDPTYINLNTIFIIDNNGGDLNLTINSTLINPSLTRYIRRDIFEITSINAYSNLTLSDLELNNTKRLLYLNITHQSETKINIINSKIYHIDDNLILGNVTSESHLYIDITSAMIEEINEKLFQISSDNSSKQIIILQNISVEQVNQIPLSNIYNKTTVDIQLSRLEFDKAAENILNILSLQGNISISADTINISDCKKTPFTISLTDSHGDLNITNIKIKGDLDDIIDIKWIDSIGNLTLSRIYYSGRFRRLIYLNIFKSKKITAAIENLKINMPRYTGIDLNIKDVNGSITLKNIFVGKALNKGINTFIKNSNGKLIFSNIIVENSSYTGIEITSLNSSIKILNSSIIENGYWDLFLSGGNYTLENITTNILYVGKANYMKIMNSKFNEVKSIIKNSNVTIMDTMDINVTSSIFPIRLENVKIYIYDSQEKLMASTVTDRFGQCRIILNYNISEEYRAHPLNIIVEKNNVRNSIYSSNYTLTNYQLKLKYIELNLSGSTLVYGNRQFKQRHISLNIQLYGINGKLKIIRNANETIYKATYLQLDRNTILIIYYKTEGIKGYILINYSKHTGILIAANEIAFMKLNS